MATSMLASVGGQAWKEQGEVKKNMSRRDLLSGAKDYIGLLEGGKRGKLVILKVCSFLIFLTSVSVIMRARQKRLSTAESCAEDAKKRGVGL